MKVEESLNVTFDESPPPTKLSPLVDDDVGEEEAIKKNTKVVNNNNEEDESIEVDEIVTIKESKNQRTLRSLGLEDSKTNQDADVTEIKLTKDDEADSVDSSKYRGCCLTSWLAKKQMALAISMTEAEYVSARKACQQALWMKQALIAYGIRLDDVPIMCDNKGAIDL
ncbi:hypothetical protein Tco_0756305 [Tanacetum coccineum]